MTNPDAPARYAAKQSRDRMKALARARRAAGVTQADLDRAYRQALDRNPGANTARRQRERSEHQSPS